MQGEKYRKIAPHRRNTAKYRKQFNVNANGKEKEKGKANTAHTAVSGDGLKN